MKKFIFCLLLAGLGAAPALMGDCTVQIGKGKGKPKVCSCTNCNSKCPTSISKGRYTQAKGEEVTERSVCSNCKHRGLRHKCTCPKKDIFGNEEGCGSCKK